MLYGNIPYGLPEVLFRGWRETVEGAAYNFASFMAPALRRNKEHTADSPDKGHLDVELVNS